MRRPGKGILLSDETVHRIIEHIAESGLRRGQCFRLTVSCGDSQGILRRLPVQEFFRLRRSKFRDIHAVDRGVREKAGPVFSCSKRICPRSDSQYGSDRRRCKPLRKMQFLHRNRLIIVSFLFRCRRFFRQSFFRRSSLFRGNILFFRRCLSA